MAPEHQEFHQPRSEPDVGDEVAAGEVAESNVLGGEVRTFEVHALGPTGAGKTVFMASLYKRLNIKRPELPFFLKSDYSTGLELNHTYNQIANPDEKWPSPTQQIMEWSFTACVPTPAGDFEPVRYTYLDYPGGVLTNPRAMQDERIRPLIGRLQSADALLVLLDGQRVMELLRDERSGSRYLELEITSSLEILQQSRCPVHFVVTKWDLLEGHHTLEEAHDRLMKHHDFADLIASKTSDTTAPIRLFPVSAVGPGFAELQPSGEMTKVGAHHPKPVNVELPLVSVVPDTLHFVYLEAENSGGAYGRGMSKLREQLEALDESGKLQRWGKNAGKAVRVALLKKFPKQAWVARVNIDPHIEEAIRHIVNLAKHLDAPHARKIVNLRDALDELSLQFTQILSAFEEAEPASVLAGGLADFPLAHRAANAAGPRRERNGPAR
jgi:hypothetical protein